MTDKLYQNLTNSDEGGYLVPEELATEILGMVEAKSVCQPYLRPLPMTTMNEKINYLSTKPTAAWVATEAAAKTASGVKWGQMELDLEELAVIIPFSDRWAKFANLQVAQFLKGAIAEAIVQKLDRTYLGYETDSPFTNEISVDISAGNTIAYGAGADLVEDLSDAMGVVEAEGYVPNGWACPIELKALLRNLRDDNNRPIFEPANAASPATLFGLPIRFSTNMVDSQESPSTKEIIVADWTYAYEGKNADIIFDMTSQATITLSDGVTSVNLWEKNMSAIKAYIYRAFAIYKIAAFAKVTGF